MFASQVKNNKRAVNSLLKIAQRSIGSSVLTGDFKNSQNVVIFGGSGQLAKYIGAYVASRGARIIAPYRNNDAYHIREMKMVSPITGMVVVKPYDMTDPESLVDLMSEADVVINCIGSSKVTRNFDLHDANVKTAQRIAKYAKEAGVPRFIHISAAGASPTSPSTFQECKYESELAVKAFYPNASIIRPTWCVDPNDSYINSLARNFSQQDPFFSELYIYGCDTKIQPVLSRDVGLAVGQIFANPQIDGQTWTLAGDKVFTREDLYYELMAISGQTTGDYHQSGAKREIIGYDTEDTITRHQTGYTSSHSDGFPTNGSDIAYFLADNTLEDCPKTKGFKELGIKPIDVQRIFIKMMNRYLDPTAAIRDGSTNVNKWNIYTD